MDTRTPQEEELVERLRNRDETAITDLLRLYGGKAKSLVSRMLGPIAPRISYEDVLSEAVTKVWLAIGGYDRRKARFSTWLLRIVHNHTVDVLRKYGDEAGRTRPIALADNIAAPTAEDPEPDPCSHKRAVRVRRVREEIARLDAKSQAIVEAYANAWPDIPDLQSLGRELDLAPDAVRKRWQRAHQRIRDAVMGNGRS